LLPHGSAPTRSEPEWRSPVHITPPESKPPGERIILYMTVVVRALGGLIAWTWTILACGVGLELLITRGPWPPTNGWFLLFSGLSACPVLAWLLKKYRNVGFPGWTRFLVAFLIIVAGRVALVIEGRAPFLPSFLR